MQVSPWLRVAYNHSVVNVDHELAAVPAKNGEGVEPCEPVANDLLQYEIFHYYLGQRDFSEDSFFNAIRLLRTVNGAQENGREVSQNSLPAFFFLALIINYRNGWAFSWPDRFERLGSCQQHVHCLVYTRAWVGFLP